MLIIFRRLLLCLIGLWLPVGHAADSGWLHAAENTHASVRLRAQTDDASHVRLLLDVTLEKGWKTYWRSPGEGGLAPTIQWQTPLTMNWRWPVPQRFDVAGISTQGYHDDVTFPITLHGPVPAILAGTLTLSTCSNVCILTDYPFTLDMTAPAGASFDTDFSRAMGTLPLQKGLTRALQARYHDGTLTVSAERDAGWRQPALYIDSMEDVAFSAPAFRLQDNLLLATLKVTDGWGDAAPDITGKTLSLVLEDQGLAQESQTQIERGEATGDGVSLWLALAMALAGGLILNVMPCVLPVLAMKLGGIMQSDVGDRRSIRLQFIASVVGMMVSFLALALMMTLLRLGHQATGWGIQFQNPWFIGAMAMVMVVFGASLSGLFEFRLSSGISTFLATRGGHGLAGHFWQGAFATLLATPCTAPFLGTAISVALVAPLPVMWGIFFAMGLGMSLPWLLIAVWPGLARYLPRPGRWMHVVRLVLGAMMLGSALWLFSLLAVHLGTTMTLWLVAAIAMVLMILVLRRWHWRIAVGVALATSLVVTGGLLLQQAGQNGPLRDRVNWQPLSEQAITDALARHQRVFIDITADWCVTCKANKFNVLLRDDVQEALTAPDVVALRGDWSRASDAISQFLNRRQRAAVPFNQIYGPGLIQGQVLPALLSREDVLHTLSAAKGTP